MRSIDSLISTAMSQPVARMIFFVRIHFDEGVVAWHSGFNDIALDGVTYTGVGTLGNISAASEENGVKSSSMTVTVSGINPDVITQAMTTAYNGRRAYVHFTLLDDQDRVINASPVLLFVGTVDEISGTMGATASFGIALKSRLADWERARKVNYTDVEQQRRYPGDRGLEFVAQLSRRRIVWPRAKFLPDPRD